MRATADADAANGMMSGTFHALSSIVYEMRCDCAAQHVV
jgi:hypothetical protein